MKKILPYLYLVLFTLNFVSCDQVELDDIQLERKIEDLNQDVVFQYTALDLATEQVSGWLLNGKGEVMTYAMSLNDYFADKPNLADTELQLLQQSAQSTGKKVDLQIMVKHFMNIPQLKTAQLGEMVINEDQEIIHSVVAYRKIRTQDLIESDAGVGHGCGGDSIRETISYDRIILQEYGLYNRENESEAAQALLSWFWGVEADL